MVHNDIFDSILSTQALIKGTTFGIALIQLKLILDQRKQIDELNYIFGHMEDLFEEIQAIEDIPTDIKHKIDSLLNNQSKRGE